MSQLTFWGALIFLTRVSPERGFTVAFYRPDEDFLTTEKTSDVVRNVIRNVVLKNSEQSVLSAIMENPEMTADEIAKIISKSPRTVQRYLDSLQKKKLIYRIGPTKGGHWVIKAPLTVIATGIDYADSQLISENGDIMDVTPVDGSAPE